MSETAHYTPEQRRQVIEEIIACFRILGLVIDDDESMEVEE